MILTGIGDEAGNTIDAQIAATKKLGWQHLEARGVEVSGFPKANLHDIPDKAFDLAAHIAGAENMFLSAVGSSGFDYSVSKRPESVRTIADETGRELDPRCEVTKMFLDAGITPVHETCMNYGGMSWRHALELLDQASGLKWVFDTANPVFNPDRSKPKPWPRQDPWEFWEHVRDHVVHIHVKDATWNPAKNDADYNWPGEGQGRVRDILKDALARGYDGGVSIEPHMVVVFHDTGSKSNDAAMGANYVEYGRRLERLIQSAKPVTRPA